MVSLGGESMRSFNKPVETRNVRYGTRSSKGFILGHGGRAWFMIRRREASGVGEGWDAIGCRQWCPVVVLHVILRLRILRFEPRRVIGGTSHV